MFEPIERGHKNYKTPSTAMLVDEKGDVYSLIDLFKGVSSGGVDLTDYYTKAETYAKTEVYAKTETYTKGEVDTKVGSKANASDVYAKAETYTKAEVDALIEALRTELTPPAQ